MLYSFPVLNKANLYTIGKSSKFLHQDVLPIKILKQELINVEKVKYEKAHLKPWTIFFSSYLGN